VGGKGTSALQDAALGTVGRNDSLQSLGGGGRHLRQAAAEAAMEGAATSLDARLASLAWLKEPAGGWLVWQPPPGQNTPLTNSGAVVAADAASSATRNIAAQARRACWLPGMLLFLCSSDA
jgi:hypothetical protein